MHQNRLIGTWRLVEWENRDAEGQVSYPLGRGATGYITYTADGYMFVALMRAGRPAFAAGDLLGGTPEERTAAAESYISYAGTYEVHADRVIHHVLASLFPNWVGTDQERFIDWDDERLILSTAPTLFGGSTRTAHLIWERVAS